MKPLHIVLMAAGQGKRMRSKLPKVAHSVLFKPMIRHVLDTARSVPHASLNVVVGHGEDAVRGACAGLDGIQFFKQVEQRGTADAVASAGSVFRGKDCNVLVLSADVILLSAETLNAMLAHHSRTEAAVTFLSAALDAPFGYGRVLRQGDRVVGIREEVDCSVEERKIRDVNSGVYCFDGSFLESALDVIQKKGQNQNKQGEFYLTDAIALAAKEKRAETLALSDPREMAGINDRVALSEVEAILRHRTNYRHQMQGVTIQQPETVWIDSESKFGEDVTVGPSCRILRSQIGEGCEIEAGSVIVDSVLGAGTHVRQGSYLEKATVGAKSVLGPYARLREGSALGEGVRIGNFVEVKNSRIGSGTKSNHLAYIGDAEIGEDVNLGCGFITCNYDGKKKHKTRIENDVFVGSDSHVVAPVNIGRGSMIAAGTTVTEDVPEESLVLSRGKQVTKPGYAKKYQTEGQE